MLLFRQSRVTIASHGVEGGLFPLEPARRDYRRAAVIANAAILGAFAVAAVLAARDPDLYHRLAQQDELAEWGTVWAFLLAALLHLALALRYRLLHAWFPLGVAVFCVFVAGEEVAWGQRMIGQLPSAYLLEHGFLQGLNVHNLIEQDLRKTALTAVIAGYGLLLPLLGAGLAPGWVERVGVRPPPATLGPAFLAILAFHLRYPVDLSGEWVELTLGLGFLSSGALLLGAAEAPSGRLAGATPSVLASLGVVALLSFGTERWTRQPTAVPASSAPSARTDAGTPSPWRLQGDDVGRVVLAQ